MLDGLDAVAVAGRIGSPRVELRASVTSTMDEAHRLAEAGAPSGTVVIADEQAAGRGRFGRRWASGPGAGLWVTTLHRDVAAAALDVLSIRIGLALAARLDAFAEAPVQLKWPNDLLVAARKVGGILVEARWRDITPEWVAVGLGVNLVRPPSEPSAAALRAGTRRVDLLAAIFPAMVEACRATGDLTPVELREFAGRDAVRDADVVSPARGVARGVSPKGALIVDTEGGRELFRRGSLVRVQEER